GLPRRREARARRRADRRRGGRGAGDVRELAQGQPRRLGPLRDVRRRPRRAGRDPARGRRAERARPPLRARERSGARGRRPRLRRGRDPGGGSGGRTPRARAPGGAPAAGCADRHRAQHRRRPLSPDPYRPRVESLRFAAASHDGRPRRPARRDGRSLCCHRAAEAHEEPGLRDARDAEARVLADLRLRAGQGDDPREAAAERRRHGQRAQPAPAGRAGAREPACVARRQRLPVGRPHRRERDRARRSLQGRDPARRPAPDHRPAEHDPARHEAGRRVGDAQPRHLLARRRPAGGLRSYRLRAVEVRARDAVPERHPRAENVPEAGARQLLVVRQRGRQGSRPGLVHASPRCGRRCGEQHAGEGPLAHPRARPLHRARVETHRRARRRAVLDRRLDRCEAVHVEARPPQVGRDRAAASTARVDAARPLHAYGRRTRARRARDGDRQVTVLAQLGGPVACGGLAGVIVLDRPRLRLLALAIAALGAVALGVAVAPREWLVVTGGAIAALGVAVGLAGLYRARPWLFPVLALACVPIRIGVHVGGASSKLLVPLYVVALGAAVLLAWELGSGDPRSRELRWASAPLAAVLVWTGLSLLWSKDVSAGAVTLLAFYVPFAVVALSLARLPWSRVGVRVLYAEVTLMGLVFAAIGIYQYE